MERRVVTTESKPCVTDSLISQSMKRLKPRRVLFAFPNVPKKLETPDDFLAQEPHLRGLIKRAEGKLVSIFGKGTTVRKELAPSGCETDLPTLLFLIAETELASVEARRRMEQLNRDWWRDQLPQTEGKVRIAFEYRVRESPTAQVPSEFVDTLDELQYKLKMADAEIEELEREKRLSQRVTPAARKFRISEESWPALNERRSQLIEKEIDGSLTDLEEFELANLEAAATEYLKKKLPGENTLRIERLLKEAQVQDG